MCRFVSAWVGYIAALVLTVIIMILYNHAQPALLYLVPANIGCRFEGWGVVGAACRVYFGLFYSSSAIERSLFLEAPRAVFHIFFQ